MKSILTALCLVSLAAAAPALQGDPGNDTFSRCRTVEFTVNGSAQNRNITGIDTTDLSKLRTFYAKAPLITVSGPQIIRGTYCGPLVANKNNDKLQVYFHSVLSTRESWQALGGVGTEFQAYQPAKYSWEQFANGQGYATLAIDRLGAGKSSRPDGTNVVQAPYEIALYNDLARQLRSSNTQLPKYQFLIYVGNSHGSQLGCGVAGTYPNAFNEFILTGFTKDVGSSFSGVSLFQAKPASTQDPRFSEYAPDYLTASVEQAYINSFFGSKQQVSYDDVVADLNFKRRNIVTTGQFVSVFAYPFNGAGFTGRILVLDGEQDQPFCGPGSPVVGPASCGTLPAQTKSLFPDANYNWKTVNKTGHAIQLCNSAQTVFGIAHLFLAGANFSGGPPV